MRISRLAGLLCMVAVFYPPAFSAASDDLTPPADYLHAKLRQNDVVFLGTKHKQPEILDFIAELIPSLKGVGVTHLGLEIPSDQQEEVEEGFPNQVIFAHYVYPRLGNSQPP